MLDERKASILLTVVEEYIHSAQPVGSSHVAAAPGVQVSSATVRNDMVVLEQEGYLRQPHTSAGRVPTDKGYRYFVDSLVGPSVLDQSSAQQVRSFFNRAHGELEQMLFDTTRLLSSLTDSAAVVVGPPQEAAVVRSAQFVALGPRVVLAVVVLSNGVVEKRTLELDAEAGVALIAAATAHMSALLVGSHLARTGTVSTSGDPTVDDLVTAALTAFSADDNAGELDHVFVGGAARVAGAFEAVDTVREVLTILEQQLVVVTLLRDVLDRGLNVAIGAETGMEPLSECSLVVAPYSIDGEAVGTIAVLGPTRMNYQLALASVAVVGKRLGQRLSEG